MRGAVNVLCGNEPLDRPAFGTETFGRAENCAPDRFWSRAPSMVWALALAVAPGAGGILQVLPGLR